MGDITEDMQNEAMRWADEVETCSNGHRFIDDGWGCYQCELSAEEETLDRAGR